MSVTLRSAMRLPDRVVVYQLEIPESSIALATLDEFDMLLERECRESKHVCDKLLWLQALVRKIEEPGPTTASPELLEAKGK